MRNSLTVDTAVKQKPGVRFMMGSQVYGWFPFGEGLRAVTWYRCRMQGIRDAEVMLLFLYFPIHRTRVAES